MLQFVYASSGKLSYKEYERIIMNQKVLTCDLTGKCWIIAKDETEKQALKAQQDGKMFCPEIVTIGDYMKIARAQKVLTCHRLGAVTKLYEGNKEIAVAAILDEFCDCLLKEFVRYETFIPYGESDNQVAAEYLKWSGNGLSFALYITEHDTQIVCDALPSCTFVEHKEVGYVQKLKRLLSEPNVSGFFKTIPAS